MTVTGVMLVRNQAPTVDMAIRSVAHVVDAFHAIDHGSRDGTRDAAEAALADLDVPTSIETRQGDAGDHMAELINERCGTGYALRVEGDQVHWPDRIERVVEHAQRETTVCYQSAQLQNRYDLQNALWPVNPPHPMLYDAEAGVERLPGMIWPRGAYGGRRDLDLVASVNARVHEPIYRLMRWHRTGGAGFNGTWWNRPPTDEPVPIRFEVPEVEPPYWDHFSMREYMRLLRERGQGSIQWPGFTLEEVAEHFVEWDMGEHCEPYEGEYPPLMREHIDQHGVGWP